MSLATCIGCGGLFAEADGPAHRYLEALPGCWACFGEDLAREYSDLLVLLTHGFEGVNEGAEDTAVGSVLRPEKQDTLQRRGGIRI